ncbi:MAG: hypothetical protein ACMG6S_11240, partial [Byssovorax sp.]
SVALSGRVGWGPAEFTSAWPGAIKRARRASRLTARGGARYPAAMSSPMSPRLSALASARKER